MSKVYEVLAIVQARCSSSRLPGKVLHRILDKPMILHELERLQRCKEVNHIVLATSSDADDNELANIVSPFFDVYRGSLDDVLDRYYQCAIRYRPKHVVRITGDCPVIDWRIVDSVVKQHLTEQNDYTSLSGKFPDGLDTEVCRFSVLEQAWKNAKMISEREHVTLYIKNHPEIFTLGVRDGEKDLSFMRWTVDEPRDMQFIQQVFAKLYPVNPDFSMQDVLNLLNEYPELQKINQGIQRNEGLMKSLANDKEWQQ